MGDPGPELPNARVPPQNLDAEESVLGAMLLSAHAIDACVEELTAGDFYRESHGTVFNVCVELHAHGHAVDAITVTDALEKKLTGGGSTALNDIGGRGRIHELAALVPATANARHYARIVHELAVSRSLIRAGGEVSRIGWEHAGDAPAQLEEAEALIFALGQDRRRTDLKLISGPLADAFRKMQELQDNGREIVGLATGYDQLDRLTSGLQPGNLVIAAGRPSMGKSAFGLGIAAHAAVHNAIPTAVFTLEMSEAEVTQRLLSAEGSVESQRIRNGNLDNESWRRLHACGSRIDAAPLYIEDNGAITMGEIRSKSRRLKAKVPDLGLIVVDYLQLMGGSGTAENRVQEVSQISRQLKVLARELDVPVLALSQLSRGPEARHDKRPMLSDLRESGSIEQDADIVLFVYRDEYYNPEDPDTEGLAEVIIAKHRNGPTETVKLAFTKRFAKFSNLHPDPAARLA